jgi:hypothetical protein
MSTKTDVHADVCFCEVCGLVNATATARLQELEGDLTNAELDKRKLRRRVATLEGERGRLMQADKHYKSAQGVLNLWRELCAPGAKEPYSETRMKPLLARLHAGYTVGDLVEAIQGYARFPYVVRGRRVAFGHATDRVVDAEFIFRNAQHVDRGRMMARSDLTDAPVAPVVAKVPWRKVWEENRRLVLAALEQHFEGAQGLMSSGQGYRAWPCPFCIQENRYEPGHEPLTLQVVEGSQPGARIASCSVCGLTEDRILASIIDYEGLLG